MPRLTSALLPRLVTAVSAPGPSLAPGLVPAAMITNTNGATRSMVTGPAYDDMKEHLMNLRLAKSKYPVPYSGDQSIVPFDPDTFDQEHKKVTVVGCGQVGMAIAVSYSYLYFN
jgi:hypothetical protein